jgi:hypothetical protein
LKQIGLVVIAADAVVSKDVAERALLAASPPRLTPGSSTRVKKLLAQTQTLPGADLIRACRKSLKPLQRKTLTGLNAPRVQAYELKSVQSLVQHDFRNVPKS